MRMLIIITDNFCIALFSGVHKLTVLYNILQHFLSENKYLKVHLTLRTADKFTCVGECDTVQDNAMVQ